MKLSYTPCVALLVAAMSAPALAEGTGFEVSDGFVSGQPWPAGWTVYSTSDVSLGPAFSVDGGSQSLQVGLRGNYNWGKMTYTLPTALAPQPGTVTEVGIDILTSGTVPPGGDNFCGFGAVIIQDRSGYSAGSVSFDLQDWGYAYNNDATDFVIQTMDPQQWYGWAAVGGKYFTPGSAFRFTSTIDWDAGTTTLRLTTLTGSEVFQYSVNALPDGIAAVHFYGPSLPTGALPACYDNGYIGAPGPEPILGDLDGDGDVDIADLQTFAGNFGGAGNVSSGDFDGDGAVTIADLQILAGNFGTTTSMLNAALAGVNEFSAVPEPASLALLGLGGIALLRHRPVR